MNSEVALAKRAENRIRDRMRQRISIRMPLRPSIRNDMHPTKHELTPLNKQEATLRTQEADKTGVALILTTHKERAELYQEQFQTKGLITTIEPAE